MLQSGMTVLGMAVERAPCVGANEPAVPWAIRLPEMAR
jgi:hypothetical protein